MKLYEISDQIRQALQMVADGEIPEDQMQDTLEALGVEFDTKVDNTAAVIRELGAESDGIKAEIERLANMKKVKDGHIERLKDYLRFEMSKNGKKKVEGKRFTVTIGASVPVLEITGEITGYKKESLDTAAIKSDLKAGKKITGAMLVSGKEKLIIK
jgi:hypothetical protein